MSEPSGWQDHAIFCPQCSSASEPRFMCPTGQGLWGPRPLLGPPAQAVTALARPQAASAGLAVLAQTSSGTGVMVPREKTSTSISISTADGVVLHLPERDLEVYSIMKEAVMALAGFAERMATMLTADERSAEVLEELATVSSAALRLADRMGGFMKVDDETRKVIRQTRQFGVESRGLVERTRRKSFRFSEAHHDLVDRARFLAVELQGEVERRLGTA